MELKDAVLLVLGAVLGWVASLLVPFGRRRRPSALSPVGVSVVHDRGWPEACDHFFVVGTPPPHPRLRQPMELWSEWASDNRGMQAGSVLIKLAIHTIEGGALLRSVRVPHFLDPLPGEGAVYTDDEVGGGFAERLDLAMWLDDPLALEPVIQSGERSGTRLKDYQLESEDFVLVYLTVHAGTPGVHRWWIELDFISDGHEVTKVVKDNGQPFALVGTTDLPEFRSSGGPWRDASEPYAWELEGYAGDDVGDDAAMDEDEAG